MPLYQMREVGWINIETNLFETVLQVISTGLVEKIIAETGMEEDAAVEKLYLSALYSELEKENTKVWHYSVPKLYELWEKETKTGQLILPAF